MNKFFITTAIAYVNAPPHIGFLLEVVQADVLARYHRRKGEQVFFQSGTDEHGAKIARAAEAASLPPQELADANFKKFEELGEQFNLSWDVFVRTTDQKRHWPAVYEMWSKLAKSDDLYKKKYRGLYCVGHEAFITEKDLVNGKCRDHDAAPEVIEEENWFFKLSKYSKEIESKIKNDELRIMPEGRKNEILSLIKEGLEDVSFSRPRKGLAWGIPVPGDDSQTIYVWADALTNYLDYADWWPADVQVIGKDILRFHAAIWPGMLLSAKMPLPKNLFVHGFITVDARKMSKTLGNVVSPVELLDKYGADPVRYYLLREIPASEDGDFSYSKFEERYNGDLANGLGNFAARVLTLAEKKEFDVNQEFDGEVKDAVDKAKKFVEEKIGEFKLHEALAAIWNLIGSGDSYVNDKKPWESGDAKAIFGLVVILDNVAALLAPFLPETSKKITDCIRWEGNKLKIKKSGILFPRLAF